MYTVSALWATLIATDGHWFETYVDINGVTYGQDQIMSMSTELRMFSEEQPTVGGCLAGELTLKMLVPSATIPRMASIEPYVRVCTGTQQAEWIPQGKYFIDTRETTRNDDGLNILTIHAYDSMLKAEGDYPSTSHSWPYTDINVVNEIATTLGVGVDSRTTALMTNGYQASLPAGMTMRETLGNIAAMYAGNWVMSYDGELLLIAVNGIPPETNYLVTAIGEPITFGGDRILV
jgi:hypothetical protein